MAGEEATGILDAGGAFAGGFEEVAHLSGDVADDGHGEEMRKRDGEPEMEGQGDKERAEHAGDGAFPGFFRRDVRGEGIFAERTAGEVGQGVRGPDKSEGKEEEARAEGGNGVKANGEGEREGDEEKSAGAYARGRE